MSAATDPSTPPGIDPAPVSHWLEANVVGAHGPFRFDLIAGGRSNLTYKVTAGDRKVFVLRRPPLGHVLATAHDMGREHKIIAAVGQTEVPVAPALGYCAGLEVNGAPFYVMGYVDGLVLDSPEAGQRLTEAQRATASRSLIEVLAKLHAVDPAAIGLGDLGKREGYIERQLRRWSTQWANSKTRELASIDRCHELLEANRPEQIHTGIVHGDYRLGNCMVATSTCEIVAVLDWELCTLGDLLADVGYLLVYWNEVGSVPTNNDPSGVAGFPSRQQLLTHYAELTGRDLSGISYYEAFSCWRLACISEGVLARYKAGVMGDDSGFDLANSLIRTAGLADRALGLLEAL